MSASLLDSLTSLITPDLASRAASMLGESDSSVRKGLTGVFPVLLAGAANRSSDPGFAGALHDIVRSPANDGNVLNDVAGLLGAGGSSSPMMGLGGKLLNLLFGGNTTNLANALAGFAGVKSSTGSTMLNLAAPLVLAALGRRARSDNLNASSLASLLLGQKDSIAAALPGPLANLGSFLAAPAREREVREVREAYAAPPPVEERRSSIWRWLLPLLIALGLLWLLSSLFGRKERPVDTTPPSAAVEPAPAPAPEVAAPAAITPTANVYFDVDQSALPAGSDTALSSVIDYLKANPASTAVISGYHDPTGDQAANEELAKNRAGSVRDALVAAGIAESRIDMQKPTVTTGGGTLEDARRVEVTVR
jgi:outer membrane protein OmpA-like peptidoglycan-associated protein